MRLSVNKINFLLTVCTLKASVTASVKKHTYNLGLAITGLTF